MQTKSFLLQSHFSSHAGTGKQYLEISSGNPRSTMTHAANAHPPAAYLAFQQLCLKGRASLTEERAFLGGWRIAMLRKAWGCFWGKVQRKGESKYGARKYRRKVKRKKNIFSLCQLTHSTVTVVTFGTCLPAQYEITAFFHAPGQVTNIQELRSFRAPRTPGVWTWVWMIFGANT